MVKKGASQEDIPCYAGVLVNFDIIHSINIGSIVRSKVYLEIR